MIIIWLEVIILIMNKSDIKLIIFVILIVVLTIIIINLNKSKGNTVEVYYEDDLVLSMDLYTDNIYTVKGLLGDVVIEVKDKKVRVVKENSPKNICSKEGYISDSTKPLICLPNKIVIKIVQDDDVDGVVY